MIFFPVFATIEPRRSPDFSPRVSLHPVASHFLSGHASEISLRSHMFPGYLLSFDILPNSFALTKNSTRLFSSKSELFSKNTGGWRSHPSNQRFPSLLSAISKSFICNTYRPSRKCCKQKTYESPNSFRCNTYRKPGVGAPGQAICGYWRAAYKFNCW